MSTFGHTRRIGRALAVGLLLASACATARAQEPSFEDRLENLRESLKLDTAPKPKPRPEQEGPIKVFRGKDGVDLLTNVPHLYRYNPNFTEHEIPFEPVFIPRAYSRFKSAGEYFTDFRVLLSPSL